MQRKNVDRLCEMRIDEERQVLIFQGKCLKEIEDLKKQVDSSLKVIYNYVHYFMSFNITEKTQILSLIFLASCFDKRLLSPITTVRL